MRKLVFYTIFWILLVNISIVSSFYIISGHGAAEEINPDFGNAPIIDGNIDDSTNEWKEAVKIEIQLIDLSIDLWVMQTNRELFISIQLDLQSGYHNTTEFFGLLLSTNSSENIEDFIDAKFIQFTNISANSFVYLDYYINNSLFLNDTRYDGDGAAKLEGDISTYEFSIPIGQTDINGENEDSIFDYEESYALNVTYGDNPAYPQGIKKSEIVLININAPGEKKIIITSLVLIVLSIIVYSSIAVLFGFYIYKMVKLKEKIKRLRS
ncbi:MAG: hypothetical protein KGD58_01415 [Candidatus Lokiarchaeota archaeon]|nr:hypothetical protein [Candidatus Lokiarchaeota archaeon]